MDEDRELFDLWRGGTQADSDRYYNEVSAEGLERARRRSGDLFARIDRNVRYELILSVGLSVAILAPLYGRLPLFWALAALMGAVVAGLALANRRYRRELCTVAESDVVTSLRLKIDVLRRYLRRMRLYLYLLTPVGFYVGMAAASSINGSFAWRKFGVAFLASLPVLLLLLWVGKKYLHGLYGRYLKRLEVLHADLAERK